MRRLTALLAVTICGIALPTSAQASFQVTKFELVPSTTLAGGHPGLSFSAAFAGADNNVGVKNIAFRLPPGLKTHPKSALVCSRRLMIRNDCPDGSRIGQIKITGSALGTRATVTRDINNLPAKDGELARLGAVALPGIIVALPLTRGPGGEAVLAIDDIPRIGGQLTVVLESVEVRIKRRVRKRDLITNPRSCVPANTTLDVGFYDAGLPRVTALSSFTPTGC